MPQHELPHSQQRRTAAETGSDSNNQDRRQTTEQLFARSYGKLLDSILESRQLLIQDGERLLTGLASRLNDFSGGTDEQFLSWANEILRPAVERLSQWYDLRSHHSGTVFHGIWRVLYTALDLTGGNAKAIAEELSNQVWFWAFENLDSLLTPGTANVSTRLNEKGYWAARAWKTSQLRERNKYADLQIELIGKDVDGTLFVEPEDYADTEFEHKSIFAFSYRSGSSAALHAT